MLSIVQIFSAVDGFIMISDLVSAKQLMSETCQAVIVKEKFFEIYSAVALQKNSVYTALVSDT